MNKIRCITAEYMSIAVLRSDYVTNCTASTLVLFDRKATRNRQLHIFAERCHQVY